MTYDFTNPEGKTFYPMNREILPKIAKVVNRSRADGMLIVFMQHCYRKGKYDRNLETMRENSIEGSGGEELDPMLPVDPDTDYIIKKICRRCWDKNKLLCALYSSGCLFQ